MRRPWVIGLGSLAVAALLVGLLHWPGRNAPTSASADQPPLLVYCAAGLKPPVEVIAREYERTFGVRVQLQYGGSGTLLSNLRITRTGDLFLSADGSYLVSAKAMGLVVETLPLARQRPVIAVARGNPKSIRTLEDLHRTDVRLALANPDAASIGRTVRAVLQKSGQYEELAKHATVFKPTVNDVANDVKLGSVDAGIVWDATARQYPELELVAVSQFNLAVETIRLGILSSARQPAWALRFARYLAARDRGSKQFEQFHYEPLAGDEWAERPEILLDCSELLRPAVEQTLKEFGEREGCRINAVYNCGILTAPMQAGQRPDAYLASEAYFVDRVADLYFEPVNIAGDALMIIVPKGNPKGIRTATDLTRPGLRIGLPEHEKTAMSGVAARMLKALNLSDALAQNLKAESPTVEQLMGQLRTGALDAMIACRSDWMSVRDEMDAMPIDHPLARMTQLYAVGRGTRYPQMMVRLRDALTANTSRQRFETQGFTWQYQAASTP